MEVKIDPAYVDLIIECAKQVESQDPIDWGMLAINEDDAYRLITLNTLDMLAPKYNDPDFREVMIATVVKLVVENFTLTLQLREKQKW